MLCGCYGFDEELTKQRGRYKLNTSLFYTASYFQMYQGKSLLSHGDVRVLSWLPNYLAWIYSIINVCRILRWLLCSSWDGFKYFFLNSVEITSMITLFHAWSNLVLHHKKTARTRIFFKAHQDPFQAVSIGCKQTEPSSCAPNSVGFWQQPMILLVLLYHSTTVHSSAVYISCWVFFW